MRLFRDPQFDFLGQRRVAAALSGVVILGALTSLVAKGGPRLGIDFAGGSQIVVRFANVPPLGELRQALLEEGLTDSLLQEFETGSREILIRTPRIEAGAEAEVVTRINMALNRIDRSTADDSIDLNNAAQDQIIELLVEVNPLDFDLALERELAQQRYRDAVDVLFAAKANVGLVTSWDQILGVEIKPEVLSAVRQRVHLGGHAVVNTEWVGPQVGEDLRRQAVQAIVWALMGMLAYITYRFEFKFGIAAVVALIHDVTIALGAFSVADREFNLPVIAAFLTIVGYSLNDTVVVFDRIRENNQVLRRQPLVERMNTSLNQTLSRTILTSATTLVVVLCLLLFGGPVINDFSFALLIGVVIGTYSSIYIAAPVVYVWHELAAERRR